MTKFSHVPTDEAKAAIWARILAVARHLEKGGSSPVPRWHSIIQLHRGNNEVPVYFIGYGLHEFNLVQGIALDHPIYAVDIPWPEAWPRMAAKNETEGLPTVEEMVAPYVAAIKAHARSCRCILAGHSFGGVMAFEASRQLAFANIHVEVILLFNTAAIYPNIHQAVWQKLKKIWGDRRPLTADNLAAQSLIIRLASSLWIIGWMLADMRRSLGRRITSVIAHHPEELTTKLDDTGRPITWPQIKYVYDNAMKSYRMLHTDCRGVLFRAESIEKSPSRSLDVHLGWEGLFDKGLEVVSVPGDHLSMMQRPHVSILASEISKTLKGISKTPEPEITTKPQRQEPPRD